MAYVSSHGIRIHYQPEGEGAPLLLQHGFTDRLESWYEVGCVSALKPHALMSDPRGQLLRAAVEFAGCSVLSYDRALWALHTWLDSWSRIGRVAAGMHRHPARGVVQLARGSTVSKASVASPAPYGNRYLNRSAE